MPIPDQGFEREFRDSLYKRVSFEVVSDERDMGLGLSYNSLSDTPHELDVVSIKDSNFFVFELKHYDVSEITKQIVFTFLGKVMDFYLGNAKALSAYKITMFLVTTNRHIHDSIRKLCTTYGIKLIEPSTMTLGAMDYYARDLLQKITEDNTEFKSEAEELVENIAQLKEHNDYSFSDAFRYVEESVIVDLPLLAQTGPSEVVGKTKEYYNSFERLWQMWKEQRSPA